MPAARIADPAHCGSCGNVNRAGARFCDACGVSMATGQSPAMPPRLDEQLKYITVLFADVVGSTEMVAGRSPDEAQSILTPLVKVMVDSVHSFGGTLNQMLGDGVQALFGAPVAQEDHALRACCAAVRMHEAIMAVNPAVRLRVGLASGFTLLSATGTGVAGADPAFPAHGAIIHLSSRLQAAAAPGTTLCAVTTRTLAGPNAEFLALGPRVLRGFGGQQDVFTLTGLRPSVFRFHRSIAHGLSPLIGRDRELEELSAFARTVLSHAPIAVTVVGDAGVGKSRLAWEFGRTLRSDAWQLIQVEAVSYGHNIPYQLIRAVLRAVIGVDARSEAGETICRLRRILSLSDGADVHEPPLFALLDLPLQDEATVWDRLDPLRRRDALRAGVRAVLNAFSLRRPTLILIEDLQWSDEESFRLLDFLPEADSQLLLVVTHRADFTPEWTYLKPDVLTLRPLPNVSMDRLIRRAFPDIVDRELRETIVTKSAGNPFFLEELARDVRNTDTIPDDGRRVLQPAIPSTIQAVISARIDKTSMPTKDVLVAASALGNKFPIGILRSIFSYRDPELFQKELAHLCDLGIFRPILNTDIEVAFSHALIQEVAYNGLPPARRRNLHRQIVQAIKRLDSDEVNDMAETTVYHAARGEEWDELITAAAIAGRRAASRSAYAEAEFFLRQGIEACRRQPRSDDILRKEIDLRFDLRTSLFPTSGIRRSFENSTEMEQLARQLGDRRRLGWATAFLAKDLQLIGKPGAALRATDRALALSEGDSDLTVATRYFAAQAAYSSGRYSTCVSILRELVATLDASASMAWIGTPGPSAIFFRAWLAWALARLGATEEAVSVARKMRQIADDANLPLSMTIARLSQGFALAFAGRMDAAEPILRESLSLCRQWELFAWSTNISSCLGHVLSHLGQFEEAFELLEQAVKRTRDSGILVSHANELAWLAEAHRLAGRADIASQQCREAVEIARSCEELGNEALATVVLGEALADLGSEAAAREACAQALRLANETDMTPLVARCQAVLRRSEFAPGHSSLA